MSYTRWIDARDFVKCSPAIAHSGDWDIAEQNPQKASFDQALSRLQSGDAKTAEQICRDALVTYPEDVNILCLSARALIRLRRYEEAEERLDKTRSLFPEMPRLHEILGEMYLAQGDAERAVDAFNRAVRFGLDSLEIQQKLSAALSAQGKIDEAIKVVEKTNLQNQTNQFIAEARRRHQAGDHDTAEQLLHKILMREPENVDALAGIGAIAFAKQQFTDAEIFLQRAVDKAPDFAGAWADLVSVYMAMERFDRAVAAAKNLLRLNPNGPIGHLMLANAYAMSGRHEDALAKYKIVVEMLPGNLSALSGIGHMLKTIGRQDESIETYKLCINENPQHTEAWWGLANMKTYEFNDDEIRTMLDLLQGGEATAAPTSNWLPSTPEANLCNALGFAFEQKGDYKRAFEFFERGNNVKRQHESYDPVHTEHLHDRIIKVFSSDLFAERSGVGDHNAAAIFIVGLPRTGSTLIEQILASHGDVDGTHELPELGRISQCFPVIHHDRSHYPENVIDLQDDAISSFGREYIERTRRHRSGASFFTDKNPNNFIHVGLLHLILPNAKIIDTRRHPLDTCLACYKQLFARGQSYSYDMEELGEYYLQYRRLMDHWDAVLPDKVLHVTYEDLTTDLELQVRRMLEHCGLPWDQDCLKFYETQRDIRSASSEQVRQPIYRSSVQLWRHYETQLGELMDVLELELLKLPPPDRPSQLRNNTVT